VRYLHPKTNNNRGVSVTETRGISRAELAEALETLGIGHDFNAIRSVHIDPTKVTVVRTTTGTGGDATHTTITPIVGP
jgi:hypothetical protein